MSFDRGGDAGTAVAPQDALAEIAEGEGQRVIDMIDKAPPGPIETKWGVAFLNVPLTAPCRENVVVRSFSEKRTGRGIRQIG